jgi:membrane peptidoglycan carboxypeptidase
VQELTLGESALLVGMLPEPNDRDPLKSPDAAVKSAVGVLQRMVAEKMITVEQAARAENELKRRVRNGTLRRGDQVYRRLEYRPYRDLALREAEAGSSASSRRRFVQSPGGIRAPESSCGPAAKFWP